MHIRNKHCYIIIYIKSANKDSNAKNYENKGQGTSFRVFL